MDSLSFNTDSGQAITRLRLAPLSLWKWLIAILFLLCLPVAILIEQAVGAFAATAAAARNELGREVEKFSARFAFEANTSLQIRELMQEYFSVTRESIRCAGYLDLFKEKMMMPLPADYANCLVLAGRNLHSNRQLFERRLKKLVPGIKLLKWSSDLKISSDSDEIYPKWAYQKLHESLVKSMTRSEERSLFDMGYLDNLPMLSRYFGDSPAFGSFIKYPGQMIACSNPTGSRLYLFWENDKIDDSDGKSVVAGGFLAVIEADLLPKSFGSEIFLRRKAHEWKGSRIAAGWLVENDPSCHFFPYPVLPADAQEWSEWLTGKPDGLYERKGLTVSVRRSADGLILLAMTVSSGVDEEFRRSVFWLFLLLVLAVAVPVLLLLTNRRNSGMAMSIRLQIAGLFVFALALPGAAIFQLGTELLKDRQKAYENEAYKDIERVKKDIDENTSYAFRFLESVSENLAGRIMQLDLDRDGKIARPETAREILRSYVEQVNYLHFYLFNSSADLMMVDSNRETPKEGMGLFPLVQSLAKIKLRASGQLKSSGRMEVSMMDLLVEATGGANLDDIQAILRTRENRAFELQFSGRRTCFFIGQYYPKDRPDEPYVMVVLVRDSQFEKMYLRLMIEKLSEQPLLKNRIQLFFGKNDAGGDNYFFSSPLQNPWFAYDRNSRDSIMLGQLSEPTRFTGNSVKEQVVLETGQRKCLFYSFKAAKVDLHSLVALFDYGEIARELKQLRRFILISFVVSFLIVLVLARVMARSLIEPVAMLKKGVEQVEAGCYQTEIIIPGQDEMVELAVAFNNMSRGLDERARMTRYLSRSAVDAVVRGEDRSMGGKKVPATILFSDIRSFTTISESNSPEVVVSLLNEYFAVMNRVVEEHGGDIDKFIGDAIMAQFISGENLSQSTLALNAVKCALSMMEELEKFNRYRAARGLFPLKIGVGINSGEVISGNIGSPGRMDRTVIGDTVNVASRLEGMSKLGRYTCVIISRSTLELVKEQIEVERLAETAVKGKTSAVEMFEVIRLKSYNQ